PDEERAFIVHLVRDREQVGLGEGHADPFGLCPGKITAEGTGAEDRMLLAQGRFAAPTEPARPARDVERHNDALAGSDAVHLGADRLYHADGLVPKDGARFDRRFAVEEMKVR